MVTSVALRPVTLPNNQAVSLIPPPQRFLDRCVEDLSPQKLSELKSSARWQIAAITVKTVALYALSLAASAPIAILGATSSPFVASFLAGCVLGGGLLYVSVLGAKFASTYRETQDEISKCKRLPAIYQDLTQQSPESLQLTLLNMGIIWHQIPGVQVRNPESLSTLTPLIAQAKYWEAEIQTLTVKKQIATDEANHREIVCGSGPFLGPFFRYRLESIDSYRAEALAIEDKILRCKLKAAFVNAVLRQPDTNGTLRDLGLLSRSTCADHVVRNAVNGSTSDPFYSWFRFRDRTIAPITMVDAQNLSVAQLGARLLAAINVQ